ncbi:PREDICTED: pentatricopeptide repeat-containing protein At1g63330-like [Nicotiana attenuata]|uniref:Pentatricopeptide repeat-containing protein, mitochondrial n=1 Tax=Nicotiana attenuata TaxID=49451 RepID=A0A1J6JVM8_NICAT|nr:PREDICTED: pentatricopeptide repeat-containing protein At1g63330-like [Nicotiana attenuata]OIT21198.1 pentatricopeptide repeat-containing protein, mitochondrial [Nicotiana attenuata]
MVIKLSTLKLPKKIPNWVCSKPSLSSLSGACRIQIIPETNQPSTPSSDFDTKIQFLKNKLHPETLATVLDSTTDLDSSLKLFKWASLQKKFHHSADTYFQIILKLGMAGKVEEIEGFCNEMIKEKCPNYEQVLLALLDAFVRNSRLSEALCVLSCINLSSLKLSISEFNQLLGALIKEKKEFKDVLFVYKEIVKAGIGPNIDTLNYMIEALFAANRVDAALDQYKRLHKKGCNPNGRTFQIIIGELVARGRVDEALVILDDMFRIRCEPNYSSFYAHIIPLFCELNKLDVVTRLFSMMRESKVLPDTPTYGSMIKCLRENLLVVDAVKLVDEMVYSDVRPDDDVFMSIIDGLCELNMLSEAKEFLNDKEVASVLPYNALLEAILDDGTFSMARDLFDEMLERNITNESSWNIMIRYLCDNKRLNDALKYLARMIVSSVSPDSSTYSALIIGNCKLGECEDALALFHLLSAKAGLNIDLVSYAQLIECLCQKEKIQEAAEVFCFMSTRKCALESIPFDKLMKGLCTSGYAGRAIKLLPLAYYSGTLSSTAAYNSVLQGLFSLGRASDLFIVISRMIIDGCTLDGETYCILIRGMTSLGHIEKSALFFDSMLSRGLSPDSETLAELLEYLVKNSQVHVILSSVDKLVSEFEVVDSAMYNMLINALLKEGYKTKASFLLDLMLEKGWVPDASTHALLVGSSAEDETDTKRPSHDNLITQDTVDDILAEGLGNSDGPDYRL